jgi:probable F420-dependent oxidoreductase
MGTVYNFLYDRAGEISEGSAMNIAKLGVWALLDALASPRLVELAKNIEDWGYSTLWMGEGLGRDVLVSSALLLAHTRTLIVAAGIANLYARDAMAMAAARNQLNEQSGNRFLLGIGVSHAPLVDRVRGHHFDKPLATMSTYLAAMARAYYGAPPPTEPPPTVIAALGPKMLALARDAADGAHPYNVTVAQVAEARAILGPDKLLCVEQKLLFEPNPERARHIGRLNLKPYLALPNYVNSWRRAGFDDADFAGDLSDRLVDGLIAWGDEAALCQRIRALWVAGADHVCIHAMSADPAKTVMDGPDWALLERLAPLARQSNAL